MRNIVQRLKRNPVRQRRVAKDGDHIFVAAALIPRHGHAQSAERAVPCGRPVAIVFTFTAEGEAVQTVRGAQGVEAVLPTRQQFVDVSLVANIPDEFILRRCEDLMEREGQLDHPQVRSQVPAMLGQLRDQFRRISSASCSNCGKVNFLTCDGWSTMSRYRLIRSRVNLKRPLISDFQAWAAFKVGVKKESGYLYFLDKQGDVSRAKDGPGRKEEGQEQEKK